MAIERFPCSDRGHPLLARPHPDTDLICLENYEKWYEVYLLKSDGTVHEVPTWAMERCIDNFFYPTLLEHCFHPDLLLELAKVLNAEVDITSLEVAAGRWAMTINGTFSYF